MSLILGTDTEVTMLKRVVAMKLNTKDDRIEQILEAAAVVNWADFMGGRPNGLVHIEYGFAPGGTLDYLQFWLSIKRGYWLLACSYWMSASQSHGPGIRFDNGFESKPLAHILEVVMGHQNLFSLPLNLGRQGLLQIAMPTENDSKAAAVSINYALNRVNSVDNPVPTETEPSLPLTA
jgi:hypothetical protein